MAKYGLKGAYAQYLVAVKRFPEGVTSTELCELCDKDKAAVSRIVAEMEEKGLVVREGIKETLYRAKIKLTEEGRKAAEHVLEKGEVAVAIVGKGLTNEDRDAFYRAMDLIANNIQVLTKKGLPE